MRFPALELDSVVVFSEILKPKAKKIFSFVFILFHFSFPLFPLCFMPLTCLPCRIVSLLVSLFCYLIKLLSKILVSDRDCLVPEVVL